MYELNASCVVDPALEPSFANNIEEKKGSPRHQNSDHKGEKCTCTSLASENQCYMYIILVHVDKFSVSRPTPNKMRTCVFVPNSELSIVCIH